MQYLLVLRVLGILLMVFGATFIPPMAVGWLMGDTHLQPFGIGFLLAVSIGAVLFFSTRHIRREMKLRDGLLVVVSFWVVLGLIGSVPIYLQPGLGLSFSQAVFESVSGITTTGATVITGLDHQPASLLFYRQQLQWLGGLGILVLVVAFLPLLGVGGMQFYTAETTGPIKDNRLSGRISETAKALWLVYIGITVLCTLLYKIQGMSWFDAVGHAFSTVSTGGFSTHDDSFGYFESLSLEVTAIVFMLLGIIPMTLHYVAVRQLSWKTYFGSAEFRFFLGWLSAILAVVVAVLLLQTPQESWWNDIRGLVFNLVSFATTTGYTTADHTALPGLITALIVSTAIIGGCAGSTTGGMKSVRIMLLARQGLNELRRLVHPHGVFTLDLNGRPLDNSIISAVWAFFAAFVFTFMLIMFAMMATGLDFYSAYGATVATLPGLGPGLGAVAGSFAEVPTATLWVGMLAMILGRLEIFTVLVLFLPMFWRR